MKNKRPCIERHPDGEHWVVLYDRTEEKDRAEMFNTREEARRWLREYKQNVKEAKEWRKNNSVTLIKENDITITACKINPFNEEKGS